MSEFDADISRCPFFDAGEGADPVAPPPKAEVARAAAECVSTCLQKVVSFYRHLDLGEIDRAQALFGEFATIETADSSFEGRRRIGEFLQDGVDVGGATRHLVANAGGEMVQHNFVAVSALVLELRHSDDGPAWAIGEAEYRRFAFRAAAAGVDFEWQLVSIADAAPVRGSVGGPIHR